MKKKYFRTLAHLEGASLLLLLFVAMPLKYAFGMPEYVRVVGSIHGLLFVMFVFASLTIGRELGWSWTKIGLSWVIASLPFGTIVLDRRLFGAERV